MMGKLAAITAAVVSTTFVAAVTLAGSAHPATPVLYMAGDSITMGAHLAAPWRDSYPARTADLLCGYGCTEAHSVGNGGQCLVATDCLYGPNLLTTFPTQVLAASPAPTEVIIEIGVNDLYHVTDVQMENAYQQLVSECTAQGVRAVVGTIVPTGTDWPYHSITEAQRQRINTWIRNTYAPSNNLVDFDAVLATTGDVLDPAYDNGDGLHPNPYGAMRMADMTPGLGL